LRISVKAVQNGVFSQFANLKRVMSEVGTPEGKFTFAPMQIAKKLRRLCI
jgi:hypothetical protein